MTDVMGAPIVLPDPKPAPTIVVGADGSAVLGDVSTLTEPMIQSLIDQLIEARAALPAPTKTQWRLIRTGPWVDLQPSGIDPVTDTLESREVAA